VSGRGLAAAVSCVMVPAVAAPPAWAQTPVPSVVLSWAEIQQETVRVLGDSPTRSTRAAAMMFAAMHDAVQSVRLVGGPASGPRYRPWLRTYATPTNTDARVAAAKAARDVLAFCYPNRETVYDGQLAAYLVSVPDGPTKTAGLALGAQVAAGVIAERVTDNADLSKNYTPGAGPGDWQPTPPDFRPALSPLWGEVRPFVVPSIAELRSPPPPSLTSAAYTAAFHEVKSLGSASSTARTAEQTRIAFFWANDVAFTHKPPGHLNAQARLLTLQELAYLPPDRQFEEQARLFAALNLALADAGIACWDSKYAGPIDFWRPITAIRAAANDGNPNTAPDAAWQPLSPFTPPFPAYTSGHSAFGAASAAVFQGFFGSDAVSFALGTEDPFYAALTGAPATRWFTSFSQAAAENAVSRVYLGVHWRFDCDEGLGLGDRVGRAVWTTALRQIPRLIPADFDENGALSPADIFAFLNAYFARCTGGMLAACRGRNADFNNDGTLAPADIFAFLTAYFTGR
jgi:hypothetical protein